MLVKLFFQLQNYRQQRRQKKPRAESLPKLVQDSQDASKMVNPGSV